MHAVRHFDKYKGTDLRMRGINRIGNMLVPNKNYVDFEQVLLVKV